MVGYCAVDLVGSVEFCVVRLQSVVANFNLKVSGQGERIETLESEREG